MSLFVLFYSKDVKEGINNIMDAIYVALIGGVGVSVISGIFMLLQVWLTHKTIAKNDTKKLTENMKEDNTKSFDVLKNAIKVILHDRIKELGKSYITSEEINFEDLQDITAMFKIYHDELGGNGSLTNLMDKILRLPIK